jgi:hypothetical protein
MLNNKKFNLLARPLTPACGTQFSTPKSAGLNDPKEPEKYSNTEVVYGAPFYSCHITPAVMMYKYIWRKGGLSEAVIGRLYYQ